MNEEKEVSTLAPMQVEILLHHHYSPERYPRLNTPSGVNFVSRFLADGFMKPTLNEQAYALTARGEKWVQAILRTPAPLPEPEPLGADVSDLIAAGYCPTSNKHQMVSRIDRPDWLTTLALHLNRTVADFVLLQGEGRGEPAAQWADFYRRVLTGDNRRVSKARYVALLNHYRTADKPKEYMGGSSL